MDGFFPSYRTAAGALTVAFLAYHVIHIVYLAYFSPVSRVPGPILCRFTGAVDMYQGVIGGRRAAWMHGLHQKYGPIVRVSPTLCSVSDPNQLKLVYGGKLPKSKIHYEGKVLAGTDHMLTLREASEVKARRGLLLPLFQRANLEEFFAEMTRYTAQMLDQMVTEQKDKGSVDVFRWFRLMAFDVIGAVAYGTDMKMTASGKANQLVELMSQVFLSFLCKDLIPFGSLIQRMEIFPPLTGLRNAEKRFVKYGNDILEQMITSGKIDGPEDDDEKSNLLKSLNTASKTTPSITRKHVATEAGAILVAGSDTTSTAMTYACFELSKRPGLQKKLREELRSVIVDTVEWPSFKTLESLPLLNAFIKETLRVWPTLPGPLERSVVEPREICGVFLPEGTQVTMQPYTIHRDSDIFPDPLEFRPERWLEETAEMRAAFIPFSTGARNCVGMNLAWYEMRLALGVLIRRFEILPDPQTNDETMAPVEHFFVVPKAMQCRLQMRPVDA